MENRNPVFTIFLETGQKKTFAGAIEWPGWCRSGSDESAALQALLDCAPRYALALQGSGLGFAPPASLADFAVVQRLPGSTTTDFGAPDAELDGDRLPLDAAGFARGRAILEAGWMALENAARDAAGRELARGPRGGGRDLDKLIAHTVEAQRAYLGRLGWKSALPAGADPAALLQAIRQDTLAAMAAAEAGVLPERGPRGGALWPLPYFFRRAAWHILDHAWEIEDRLAPQ